MNLGFGRGSFFIDLCRKVFDVEYVQKKLTFCDMGKSYHNICFYLTFSHHSDGSNDLHCLAKNSRFADLYEVFWNRFFGSRKTKISQKGGLSLVFDSHGKLQVSYFVDIANLVPNSDVYIKLLGLFEEEGFLPATIQEMVHELPRPFPRISLCSKDGHFAINFLTKRVIIERSSTDQESSSVSSFANQIKDIISKLERFIQKKASRIAFVTSGLLKEKGKDTLNKVYGCLFKPLPFYEKETPFEWYSRSVARYTYNRNWC